ncbi:50S ribosomal protein L6 [Fervidibacter sacchari]|uniref:Large ribosomal subunit protein uL6 n=1 Tax=Candidatus Fervidibacter sacchari TaxID=1448929 RepID=A0ABT2ESB4_9BACT|nr:50S ribosomal protein L6 [Candidatus Fervidibacter sacchari]MCS3920858.1 large subunit ribosomal protein L6 [Candidatus Fervidibacter sacchari]WKU17812.1 50S ribosomal protein L6 [Candidatus Fervidibacter sacchari]
MSRIGRKPIPIPEGVTVSLEDHTVVVKGPKGELRQPIHPQMIVKIENGQVIVERPNDHRQFRALHGLYRSLIANMVEGVTKGFEKVLEVRGMGYRVEQKSPTQIVLNVGYSHPVVFEAPEGITLEVQPQTASPQNDYLCARIIVRGIDKALVGNIAAKIRAIRPPDAYKGKGIRYADEVIRLKPGKAAKGRK